MNESAQTILRNREDFVAQRAQKDLRAVMLTPEGRRFVWDSIDFCGLLAPSYANDPMATAYNEGRRSIGLWLQTRAKTEAPDLYVTAFNEYLAEQRAETLTREAAKAVPPADTEIE